MSGTMRGAGALLLAIAVAGCSGGGGGGGGSSAASSTSAASSAPPKNEYITQRLESVLSAADISTQLDQTIGASAAAGATAASPLVLRPGVYLTVTPAGTNLVLRFEADGGGVRPREALAEVAVSQALGATFIDLVEAAMATMAFTVATPGLAQPWNLYLVGASPTGGNVEVGVVADATGAFTLYWQLESPVRAIDDFVTPVAFGAAGAPTEKIGGTVHFPISKDDFETFVNRAYGYNTPQRFTDFALIPHTWLHLTVTGDAANKVVSVRFDAVTTGGARLYVAEAPASTAVGGRFFDETVARMTQMQAEEAAAAGSSRPWNSNFYYADSAKGVVNVVTRGEKGNFDIAYAVETPVAAVVP